MQSRPTASHSRPEPSPRAAQRPAIPIDRDFEADGLDRCKWCLVSKVHGNRPARGYPWPAKGQSYPSNSFQNGRTPLAAWIIALNKLLSEHRHTLPLEHMACDDERRATTQLSTAKSGCASSPEPSECWLLGARFDFQCPWPIRANDFIVTQQNHSELTRRFRNGLRHFVNHMRVHCRHRRVDDFDCLFGKATFSRVASRRSKP